MKASMTLADAGEALDPTPFLRGGATRGRRIDDVYCARLPRDTCDAAAISAGGNVRLLSRARAVVVGLVTSPPHDLRAPSMAHEITVWRDDEFFASVPAPLSGGTVEIPLGDDGRLYTVYFPEGLLCRITTLVPIGGAIEPAAPSQRWLAYGDSITQGWSVTSPGHAYPAVAARRLGLDVWNLGFAGAARGEIAVAEQIAALEADIISVAFGTNNWSVLPTGPMHLSGIVSDFVAVIRQAHRTTPIVLMSPILRPEAEQQPNLAGATLAELREAFESTARHLGRNDPALRLVSGKYLVAAEHLVDGIHPGNAGHHAIAEILGSVIEEVRGNPLADEEKVER